MAAALEFLPALARGAIAVAPRLARVAWTGLRSGAAGEVASSMGAGAVRGGMAVDKAARIAGSVGGKTFGGATAVVSHPLTQAGMMAPFILPMFQGQQTQASPSDSEAQGGYPAYPQPTAQQLPASGGNSQQAYQQPGANNTDPSLDPEIRAKTMKRLREQNALNDFYMQSLSSQQSQY